MDGPYPELDVSMHWGLADHGLPKNWQEIRWQRLGCTDYEELVARVNSKAGVLNRSWRARNKDFFFY